MTTNKMTQIVGNKFDKRDFVDNCVSFPARTIPSLSRCARLKSFVREIEAGRVSPNKSSGFKPMANAYCLIKART